MATYFIDKGVEIKSAFIYQGTIGGFGGATVNILTLASDECAFLNIFYYNGPITIFVRSGSTSYEMARAATATSTISGRVSTPGYIGGTTTNSVFDQYAGSTVTGFVLGPSQTLQIYSTGVNVTINGVIFKNL